MGLDSKLGAEGLWLMGLEYRLDDVHAALVDLERELSEVLTEADNRWKLRPDA